MIAVLLGVAAATCWSIHDLVARSYAARIGPLRMAIAVMLVGGVFVGAIVLARNTLWQAPPRGLLEAALLGIAYGFGAGSLFKAFSLGPISVVGPLTAAYPALVVLWGVINGLEPSWLQWLAIAVTLVGAVIVGRSGHADGGIHAVAKTDLARLLFFCLTASIAYAAAVIFAQNAAVAIGEYEATFVSRPVAALALLPFMAGEARRMPLQAKHWWGIVAMAILDVAGITAINLSGFLPQREYAAVGISAYGAIAVIFAALVLREKVSLGQWSGIAFIVAGVATLAAA